MCGIFAYFGRNEKAPEMVIDGLKRLEYRGYDSWGIALKTDEEIFIHKQVGKIGDFDIKKSKLPIEENYNNNKNKIIISHSRWATHGGVTEKNSHPHFSENRNIVIVHNGIFENYSEIKKILSEKNHQFITETDSEVIAHLIDEYRKNNSFEESVKLASSEIEGRYAFLAMDKVENKLIAARRGSPLIIGIREISGQNPEYFIASDIPAFLPHTNKVIYLDDNQMAVINEERVKYINLKEGNEVEKRVIDIDLDIESAEKGAYPHFMIKEIMEQKDTINRAINQDPDLIYEVSKMINDAFGTYFVGCGTAGKVCMTGEYLFAKIARKHINFKFGSEFSWNKDFLTDKSLLVCVSQSGETADTLEAIETAKEKNSKIISIVNVESSTMARISDLVIPIKAGPEKAVASTKATTAQMAIVTLLAYASINKLNEGKQLLAAAASQINDMLNPRYEEHIETIANKIRDRESMYIIGRGLNYPIALEAAIKLQEVSYIHAEGFAGGELKHGPIALISKNTPVIVLVANDQSKKEILSNAMEIKARGGIIIGISPENHEIFDNWIKVPDIEICSPILNIIPVQILAYKLALMKHNDPDKPRNLAKSVTVK